MKFRQNPLSSVVIALAVWACLLPLGDLIDREAFLLESLPIVGISAVIGLVLSLLHAPRILILLAQTVGLAGWFLGDAGTAVHDGGGALVVVGWLVALVGVLWLVRRPALGAAAAVVALALGAGVLIGRAGDDRPAPVTVTSVAPLPGGW